MTKESIQDRFEKIAQPFDAKAQVIGFIRIAFAIDIPTVAKIVRLPKNTVARLMYSIPVPDNELKKSMGRIQKVHMLAHMTWTLPRAGRWNVEPLYVANGKTFIELLCEDEIDCNLIAKASKEVFERKDELARKENKRTREALEKLKGKWQM